MKIIDAGHDYILDALDGTNEQQLTFVKRQGEKFPFNSGEYSGTNCQEVLRALINRTEYLYEQQPCAETELIIASLKNALFLFEVRASRIKRENLELYSTHELMYGTCKKCGHIHCHTCEEIPF